MLLKCWIISAMLVARGRSLLLRVAHIFPLTFSNLRKSLVLVSDRSLQGRAWAASATDRSDNRMENSMQSQFVYFDLGFYIFLTHFHCVHDCFMILEYCTIVVHEPTVHCVHCVHCPNDYRFFAFVSDCNLFRIGFHDLKLGLCLAQRCGLSIRVICEKVRCKHVVLDLWKVVKNMYAGEQLPSTKLAVHVMCNHEISVKL